MKIMLDPGHYGKYNQSPVVKDYYESEAMWKLHLILKAELENYGFYVSDTRTNQAVDRDVYDRGLASKGYDLFLSLHSNATTNESVDYPLAIVQLDGSGNAIGEKLISAVAATMQTRQKYQVKDRRGSRGEYYGVLRGAAAAGTVGIIIEHSFHTNTAAAKWLLSDDNLRRLAKAEARVLAEYYGMDTASEQNNSADTETCIENDETIWRFLKDKDLNDYAAAGIMGNLYAESGLNPKNLQNTFEKRFGMTDDLYTTTVDTGIYTNFANDSSGYGLAQWTYHTRKQALLDFAKASRKSIGDLSMQLDFFWKELQGYTGVMATLKNAKSVLEASNTILLNYERPADQGLAVQTKRAEYGQGYYDKFAIAADSPESIDGMFRVNVEPGDTLNCRQGAGTSFSVLGEFERGETLTVSQKNGNWFYASNGKQTGWVSGSYIVEMTLRDSLDKLVKDGIINSPSYWIEHACDLDYLSTLITSLGYIDKKTGGVIISTAETAIDTLASVGLINSPDYWKERYSEVNWLGELLMKVAGRV